MREVSAPLPFQRFELSVNAQYFDCESSVRDMLGGISYYLPNCTNDDSLDLFKSSEYFYIMEDKEEEKSLYDKIPAVTEQSGVIDAAIWIGYAWADEPRNHGVVMVTGDDRQQVSSAAEKLANSFWDVRSQFGFVAPVDSLAGSLKKALKSNLYLKNFFFNFLKNFKISKINFF